MGVIENVAIMDTMTANSDCSARCLPGQILEIVGVLSENAASLRGRHIPASEAKRYRLRITNGFVELIFAARKLLEESLWTKHLGLRILLHIVED